ncbi:unnamed protein product [Dimorphilus gyrociliatus]|uniref:Apple domain-containing protein n=1 Tax=Dimorphilus gyrociliatus TaxID=2664684 RepID=A0A7I8W134_9ANNE|nr:unnamed protein product [Dimorphilus gyrociliatus]
MFSAYCLYIYLLLLICVCNIFNYITTDECQVSKKIIYSKPSISKKICHEQYKCWDPQIGCYYNKNPTPGFRAEVGVCLHNVEIINVKNDTTLSDCSRECLKYNNCVSVSYSIKMKKCSLQMGVCKDLNLLITDNIELIKMASRQTTCFDRDCPENDITQNKNNFSQCISDCMKTEECIGLSFLWFNQEISCFEKREICNVFDKIALGSPGVHFCIASPLTPDLNDIRQGLLKNITDKSSKTCIKVTINKIFNLRISWPSIGNHSMDFKLIIEGNNLKKCLQSQLGLEHFGVIVYVREEFVGEPSFKGYFKSCDLIKGNHDTLCEYFCSCGEEFCQAVFIKAFGLNEDNMELCSYKIEQ